ncbi:hypothetical protein COLO4_33825 [Corchorus olitorius]|uniref:Uncharacterized protein n=1 Tax=Corchorus olitorius TaxID=93759 RepID=A0A1R3GQT5_9ROSI|nr:hypothetical protein COLO4_33825 [Corchorus olitorius]
MEGFGFFFTKLNPRLSTESLEGFQVFGGKDYESGVIDERWDLERIQAKRRRERGAGSKVEG